ncbi:MAG: cob(I)yrinic acid a,c-diamide adenosyltransferase [Candidatus Omnitrophica bacterium]|nr:cob(I)yrinic acid a,c-diamide adenosyltransferase [Candidatus Omnitrophota bacterium]
MIHIYTGKGKGKTTAALGLALRAAGAGKKIYICQFVKGREYCESKALKKFGNIKCERFGRRCFIKTGPTQEDIRLALEGLNKVKQVLAENKFDVIILDEINIAVSLGLVTAKEVVKVIKKAKKSKELILTGRNAPIEFIRMADLVTEMKEVKHYYNKGIKARKGIEF